MHENLHWAWVVALSTVKVSQQMAVEVQAHSLTQNENASNENKRSIGVRNCNGKSFITQQPME